MTIKFGTDGWRAIMAEEFTFANLEIVVQAIARYVQEAGLADRGVVIGYDNRFFAEKFAERSAEVLTGNGIAVLMSKKTLPTPVTAFAIQHYKAAGAIMLTASHNPPEYNGIKFIPEYAGPAMPEITDRIESFVNEMLAMREQKSLTIPRLRVPKAQEQGLVRSIEPHDAYIEALKQVVDFSAIGASGLKIVVDPMWGAGIGYIEASLKEAGLEGKAIHDYRDPLFGGIMPEPSASVLTALKEELLATGADLGLALDGDADRFGIIEADGSYINPNQVLTLLFHHLLTRKEERGKVARTVATTHMLDRIASKAGLEVEETPVGFKYIGQSLRDPACLLGGEESGGLSIRGHLPEKDGILACLLMVEVRAIAQKPLTEILAEISAEYGTLVSERLDLHTLPEEKATILEALKSYNPATVAGQKVVKRLAIDGVKVLLEDGSYALVRPSGTEPLFRLYVEANSEEELKAIQQDVKQALGL
ncbi:phosphoglucomutase/phosphomannomutase family protein [Heliorestis acidaminivorans]|uniref:Phosphoglucomutase n=1 Tax=Heliorestis acidaminivorans TaxID=553427 RepID=A0A6I0ESS1_9FIRM|nr:phosphoglucomutase/phosphomannomutase family protein [Heliorestis acidaminivorans]KAB2953645.1 phosphoglucomutase/phosphomannomutase family protein [Heliorestis acidaminivorans]